jgi:DNA-binding response OmpR family regulator
MNNESHVPKISIEDIIQALHRIPDERLLDVLQFIEFIEYQMTHTNATTVADGNLHVREPYTYTNLTLDPISRLAYRGERMITLTAKEYDLLEFFMRYPNQVLTRDQISSQVWSDELEGETNIIDVYIRYLRSKLEDGGELRLLHTVRGVGYVLR